MKYISKGADYEGFLRRLNRATLSEFGDDQPTSSHQLSIQITGYPRSGTTLLFQLLAKSRALGYPSNIMAPYWRTPHVGAALQSALSAVAPPIQLASLGGRTSDPLGPHEFGYFWRELQGHDSMSLKADRPPAPGSEARRVLDLVNDAFQAPTVYKNFLAPIHHHYISSEVGRSRFIDIQRDVRDTAASMVGLRRRLNVDSSSFLGPIPRQPRLHYQSDVEMVCHQISDMRNAASDAKFEDSPYRLTVDYAHMCSDPVQIVSEILDYCGASYTEADLGSIPSKLKVSRPFQGLEKEAQNSIIEYLDREKLL
ncbi:sulfotransferase [Dietzia sp. SLG310A2-38A2]|uniref:sulfotransferase n=1 Tax=Dietzia sp. SLG310A2-38A2 TaxID=1630643 RepID=UPI0015FE01A5|nr:sulfotransferase [Dietzia sp. SLG310A2-38A2]MBB1032741.1 sulfotransferase [Dietzia sp. SLG310A2-38A2]